MELLRFLRRDKSIVSKPPLLVEASKNGFTTESPIFKLPTELTMLIFHHCGRRIQYLLTISHTCQRWRHIAINDALLWTSIYIQTRLIDRNTRLDFFVSFLGMQLDRTSGLPLDVAWYATVDDDFFVATLNLIRKKAPFSRWRTLKVQLIGVSFENPPWVSSDAFTNLESLQVHYGTDGILLRLIDRTVTSRLKVLDLERLAANRLKNLMSVFAKSFTHISTLQFSSISLTMDKASLPENVVNLQLEVGRRHLFPYVQTYKLRTCTFEDTKTVDLGNLTTLTISVHLTIQPECHVLLPALRELTLGALEMGNTAEFEAPALETLYFTNINYPGESTDPSRVTHTHRSLQQPGYRLSPNTSIIADSHMSIIPLITLLSKSHKVTHAILRFDDWESTQAVLGRILGVEMEDDSLSEENKILCPRMSELKLDCTWEFSEPSASKELLLDALKCKDTGRIAPLAIYVGWKGEGPYVLLSSG